MHSPKIGQVRVCYLPCLVVNYNAGSDDGDSLEQTSEYFYAKILLSLSGFVILLGCAQTHVLEKKYDHNAFVVHLLL